MKKPLKITFELDAAGLVYDTFCPIMLDSLIDYALRPMVTDKRLPPPSRTEIPTEINLPIEKWQMNGQWGYRASALLPEGELLETTRYIRKKFRVNRLHLINGTVNLQAGAQREHNIPLTLSLVDKLVAYCVADRHDIDSLLRRNVKYLGGKRHRGIGRIESIKVEVIDKDYSLIQDGYAMRWLPSYDGLREVRLRPPYWNQFDRANCCEIGDKYHL